MENTPRLFRILLSLSIATGLLGVVLAFVLEPFLPPALVDYLAMEMERPLTTAEWILVGLILPLLPGWLICVVMMFRLSRRARTLALGLTVVTYGILLFTGPAVEPAAVYVLLSISEILWGAVLISMFFTPLSEHFSPTLDQGVQS